MISEIILFITFIYFCYIGYKKSGFYGIGSVLLTFGIIHIINSGYLGSNIPIIYIILCVILYFYYSSTDIEDMMLKVLVLITTLVFVGVWNSKEPFSILDRGYVKRYKNLTAKQCQEKCKPMKNCKYIQVPKNTALSGKKTDCYVDILGNIDPKEVGDWDIYEKKNFTPVNVCDESRRTQNRGRDYRGCQNFTKTGKTCQKWTSQYPHRHSRTPGRFLGKGLGNHNFCRNPDNEPGGIWCYTNLIHKRWEYCNPKPT